MQIAKDMTLIAMRSYDTTGWRNGTLGQVQSLAELSRRMDKFNGLYNAVRDALRVLPASYRALLVEVYIKNVPITALAQRYKVSKRTVYRKLAYARELFRNALLSAGCDEQWFESNCEGLDTLLRGEDTHIS